MLERDFLSRMDFRKDVLAVVLQPVQLDLVARRGRSYSNTPDYLPLFHFYTHLLAMLVEDSRLKTGVRTGATCYRNGRQRCGM